MLFMFCLVFRFPSPNTSNSTNSPRPLQGLIYTAVNKGMLLPQTAVVICVVSVSEVREI